MIFFFIKINNPSIVPDSYVYTSVKPSQSNRKSKKEVDYEKLFSEFEKILNRNITKEEKILDKISKQTSLLEENEKVLFPKLIRIIEKIP